MKNETNENPSERNKMLRRLCISASYNFGAYDAQRRGFMRQLESWERNAGHAISSVEELLTASGIQDHNAWIKFVNKWFLDAGVIREFGGTTWYDARRKADKIEDLIKPDSSKSKAPDSRAKAEGLEAITEDAPSTDSSASKVAELNAKLDAALKAEANARANKPLAIVITNEAKGSTVKLDMVHKTVPALIQRVRAGIHTYLVGPAGSGKTTAAEMAAEAVGLEFSFMSVGPQTTKTDILGYMNATGQYVTTEFRKRFELGGVFLFDELDAGNPGVLTCINAALANGSAAFPDGMVKRHSEFRCIAAGNTFGTGPDRQYVGRQEMDAASIDRFNFLEFPYDEQLEAAIASQISKDLAPAWVAFVQKARKAVASLAIRHVVSPRATINGLKLLSVGVSRSEVESTQVWKALKPAEVARITAAMATIR